jgi:hypothetical protein
MPLDEHPWWQEADRWWLWSPDDLLLRGGAVSHRHGEVCHAVEAVVAPEGVRVLRRAGRDLPAPVGDGWFDASTVVATDAPGLPGTSFDRRRTVGPVRTADLHGRALQVTGAGGMVLDGGTVDVEGWAGIRLRTAGILAPDVAPGPDSRPLDALPDRLDLVVLVPTPEGPLVAVVDGAGGELTGSVQGPGDRTGGAIEEIHLEWTAGTRRAGTVVLSTGEGPIALRPLQVLPGSLVGGLGSSWPIGAWVGDDAVQRSHVPAETRFSGLAGVEHEYLCAVDGVPGATRAIVALTVLGPHPASGLGGWTDPA